VTLKQPKATFQAISVSGARVVQGRIIRKEQDGIRVLVELKKGDKADAIKAIKDVLSQLEN